MDGKRHDRRGPDGRFVAAAAAAEPGTKAARPAATRAATRAATEAGAGAGADGGGPGMELKRASGDRAGLRPQLRRRHRRALTAKEIETFLATLGETCNLAHSARTAGRSDERPFRDLRRRDPAFAAAWDAAFREAYDLLELEMAARARFGTPKTVFHEGRRVARIRVHNDGMALRLLHLHRRSAERFRAAESAPRRDVNLLIDEIAARLAEIEAEEAAKKAAREADHGGE